MSKNFSIPGYIPFGLLPIYVPFVTDTGDGGE